jgi:hypothetical protein
LEERRRKIRIRREGWHEKGGMKEGEGGRRGKGKEGKAGGGGTGKGCSWDA